MQAHLGFNFLLGSVSHAPKDVLLCNPACLLLHLELVLYFIKSSNQPSRCSHSQNQLLRLWLGFGQFGKLMGHQLLPAATGRYPFPLHSPTTCVAYFSRGQSALTETLLCRTWKIQGAAPIALEAAFLLPARGSLGCFRLLGSSPLNCHVFSAF